MKDEQFFSNLHFLRKKETTFFPYSLFARNIIVDLEEIFFLKYIKGHKLMKNYPATTSTLV